MTVLKRTLQAVTTGAAMVAAPALHAASLPLCPGLQIVTAVQLPSGDYESIKTIESVTEDAFRIYYAAESLDTDVFSDNFGKLQKSAAVREVLAADAAGATLFEHRFFADLPETIPGSTAIGTSSKVLKALKSAGKAPISISSLYSGDVPLDQSVRPNVYDFQDHGELVAVEAAPATMSVLVNDAPTDLPIVRARAEFGGEPAEFDFLDDEANPLVLRYRIGMDVIAPATPEMRELCSAMRESSPDIAEVQCSNLEGGDREALQVVQINHTCAETPGDTLEKTLATTGEAAVSDIFFSFASAYIRDESAPRLAEIAAALGAHPDWRLAINGHTDNVASDAFNLDLSQRRAASVKSALVERYGIDGARLETGGFGESQPRDTNETLEGRARNRRVELRKL